MTGKKLNSGSKGKRGECEAAAELIRLFRCEARRGRQYQGSPESPDIKTTIPKVHFEVKRTEYLSLYAAMDQAEEDAGTDIPVVLHRRNNKDWLAIVALDDLPGLVKILSKLLKERE
ncbi:hypothetical protein LCGC14_0248620 [marine sediment metagenome]|uniref:Uncharacterized protein n=1 Tax=marine sediment metagenome TaxID=412755 RepID=A0A0F9U514_9ZZZZ